MTLARERGTKERGKNGGSSLRWKRAWLQESSMGHRLRPTPSLLLPSSLFNALSHLLFFVFRNHLQTPHRRLHRPLLSRGTSSRRGSRPDGCVHGKIKEKEEEKKKEAERESIGRKKTSIARRLSTSLSLPLSNKKNLFLSSSSTTSSTRPSTPSSTPTPSRSGATPGTSSATRGATSRRACLCT